MDIVVFLDRSLDIVLFLPDAGEADLLPANAISSANPAKEICRWEITSEEYEERRTKLQRDVNIK